MTKPFCLADAKAGAPYACTNGDEATVLKWERRNTVWPLMGVYGPNDDFAAWKADGAATLPRLILVMLPLAVIDGREVYVGDKLLNAARFECEVHPQSRHFDYFTWPAPAVSYPETRMSSEEIVAASWNNAAGSEKCHIKAANEAIKRAILDGDVLPMPDASTMLGDEEKHEVWGSRKAMMLLDQQHSAAVVLNSLTPLELAAGTVYGSDEAIAMLKDLQAKFTSATERESALMDAMRKACLKIVNINSSCSTMREQMNLISYHEIRETLK